MRRIQPGGHPLRRTLALVFGFAYKLDNKTVVQGGFDIAFLDGGAYEYGTNKVAVNYGNLLTGAFSRQSTGSNVSGFGSWDSNSLPAPAATPFGPGIGDGHQSERLQQEGRLCSL